MPGEDRTATIIRRSLPDQFLLDCNVQGVTLSVESMQQWRRLKGSMQEPVTQSMVVLMGPVMNDLRATSYWIQTDLSQIWAFKSVLSPRGELNVKVAMLPIRTSSPC